ncbi:MAG: glutaminyl-peptide cyclotransferase [Anaerolineae bacterium]|nr:glutaminyl-peptide cyclotransferase [Anaerolineae bacterium]
MSRISQAAQTLTALSIVALLSACAALRGVTPTATQPTAQPSPTAQPQEAPRFYTYQVIATYPHDPEAFTQGLLYADGVLFESTGLNGRSSLRRVQLETGTVLQRRDLEAQYFAEGLALVGDRLIQLTWQNRVGFVYDRTSFALLQTWSYSTEGWGLTYDGQHLIMSDGSSTLRFLDPQTFAEVRSVLVTDRGQPVERLNELEYVNGEVFANVWLTDWVVRIDPNDGRVVGWVDFSGLLSEADRQQPVDVLNGIAYDPQGDRLFVTGKLWPKLFEVRLIPR